jgi:predicted transport protein
MSAAKSSQSLYRVHPGLAMVQKWKDELPSKTGRSLEEWIAFTQKSGPPTEKERRDWLKQEHKLGTNSAWWIAERAEGKGLEEDSPEAYLEAAEKWVDAMFAGPRTALRPLYDQLLKLVLALGGDVKASPGKTAVSIYRKHVFAQIKVATNTRIDLGLALGNRKTPKRLIDTGGYEKKDRITRRIEVKAKADIDDELGKWLKNAWQMDEKAGRAGMPAPHNP